MEFEDDLELAQKLRKKRNLTVYGLRGMVSEKEAKDIIAFSEKFLGEISDLFPSKIIKLSKKK